MPELTGDPKQHDPSSFKDGLKGSCLCGSIQVTILEPDLFAKPKGHLCHCANCRKVAGSYVASNMLLDADKVKIEDRDGTLKVYEDKATGSGNSVFRSFCGKDGNPVKSETQLYPGKVIMKMGMFPRIPKPEAEGFGLHKHDWQANHEGIPIYEVKWAGPEKKEMKS
ncbi:hypothetical protein B0A48_16112 [Cryoendolithus antarcticus]|uniref:CENP-V/GFA domain-containing protein n=1 Tax=Cryoendolithus antarcticus TaxID=1507870 RepID=A0A1V8SG27_9PEZI|nr:hypothetical protein B0A48_16112 [Cryoendolithus antarcticus]